jgi:hypothetical protein
MVTQKLALPFKSQYHKTVLPIRNESMSHLPVMIRCPESIGKCPHALLDYVFKERFASKSGWRML